MEEKSQNDAGKDEVPAGEIVTEVIVGDLELLAAKINDQAREGEATDFGEAVDVIARRIVREVAVHPQNRDQAGEEGDDVAFHHAARNAGDTLLRNNNPSNLDEGREGQEGRERKKEGEIAIGKENVDEADQGGDASELNKGVLVGDGLFFDHLAGVGVLFFLLAIGGGTRLAPGVELVHVGVDGKVGDGHLGKVKKERDYVSNFCFGAEDLVFVCCFACFSLQERIRLRVGSRFVRRR